MIDINFFQGPHFLFIYFLLIYFLALTFESPQFIVFNCSEVLATGFIAITTDILVESS